MVYIKVKLVHVNILLIWVNYSLFMESYSFVIEKLSKIYCNPKTASAISCCSEEITPPFWTPNKERHKDHRLQTRGSTFNLGRKLSPSPEFSYFGIFMGLIALTKIPIVCVKTCNFSEFQIGWSFYGGNIWN